MRGWAAGIFLSLAALGQAQLNPQERQSIADALFITNLQLSDLTRGRVPAGSGLHATLLNEPLAGVDRLATLPGRLVQSDLAQLVRFLRTEVDGDRGPVASGPSPTVEVPDDVPSALKASIERLVRDILRSNELVREGLAKLSPAERRTLIEALPRYAVGSDRITFDFVRQPLPTRAEYEGLLARVDVSAIRRAGYLLAQGVQDEIGQLKEAAKAQAYSGIIRVTVNGVVVEIGGTGPDQHQSTDAVLTLDLGGNDRYAGRYGAGVGYCSLLIDLSGDDTYDVPDLSIGAAVLGVGIAHDLQGDDRYLGRSICFGSALVGVGALVDESGIDEYRSASTAQGFAMQGQGLLLDGRGDDSYRLGLLGQGGAQSHGLGMLIDKQGDDQYRGGDLVPSSYVENATYARCQGFGEGDSALGVLVDASGKDIYRGDLNCQGFGANKGAGALIDADGSDVYVASHDSQARGTQLGAGYVVDSSGNDLYAVRVANSHAFSSSGGLAVFVDRAGDDVYSGRESRPASAGAESTSLFLDSGGDDVYQGAPGATTLTRGAGSIAVFADLTGTDRYRDGMDNGFAGADGLWGSAVDSNTANRRPAAADPPVAGSKPKPADAQLSALVERAARDDRAATDELVAIGEPALRWLLANRLSESTVSLTSWLALQIGQGAEDLCVAAIDFSQPAVAEAAIQVCGMSGFRRAGPRIVEALRNPQLAPSAIRAAGALEVVEAVPALSKMIEEPGNPNLERAAMALAQIGQTSTLSKFESWLASANANMRLAGIWGLAKQAVQGKAIAKKLVASDEERTARAAIQALSQIGDAEAISLIAQQLNSARKGIVIESLIALDGRFPRDVWPQVVQLRQSPDPLVKAVALKVYLGR